MIFGIGTDIVEVSRIEDSLSRFGDAFAQRILNEREWLSYSQSQTQARFLAKRFAAKEAFAKALGTGLRAPATFQNIEIVHDDMGKPMLNLAADLQALLYTHGIRYMNLSVSD